MKLFGDGGGGDDGVEEQEKWEKDRKQSTNQAVRQETFVSANQQLVSNLQFAHEVVVLRPLFLVSIFV